MQIRSYALIAGFTMALSSGLASAQSLPQNLPSGPGATGQSGGQNMSSTAKEALNNVKSARSNIHKKDYTTAKTNISSARENLKSLQSSSGLGQASPLSKVDKQLSGAEQALGNNQPKAADKLLNQAEGPLKSMG